MISYLLPLAMNQLKKIGVFSLRKETLRGINSLRSSWAERQKMKLVESLPVKLHPIMLKICPHLEC